MHLWLLSLAFAASPAETTALNYLLAESQGDYPTAYSSLSQADRDVQPLTVWADAHTSDPLWSLTAPFTSFRIEGTESTPCPEHIEAVQCVWTTFTVTRPDPQWVRQTLKSRGATSSSAPLLLERWHSSGQLPMGSPSPLRLFVMETNGQWWVHLGLNEQMAATLHFQRLQQTEEAESFASILSQLTSATPDPYGVVESLKDAAQKLQKPAAAGSQ